MQLPLIPAEHGALSDFDRDILDAFAALPELGQRNDNYLHERFGNVTRLFQYLNALIDTEAALAYQPQLVHRLRVRRDTGRRALRRAS